jgi:uncharacterized protein YdeI (YjbR/CyaY-like superfamily)
MTAAPKPTFFPTPADFRRWLKKNHAKVAELWVGFHKKGTNRPSITWPQSVDEALCFGWIDGVRYRIDDSSYRIRFTPRKPKSIWSKLDAVLERRFKANRKAWEFFRSQAPSYQRTAAWWVTSAKQKETQQRRLAQLMVACASGRRLGP